MCVTFHCVAIVGDLVFAGVFKSWREICLEAMHILLPAFYSWITVSPLKRFLAKLDVQVAIRQLPPLGSLVLVMLQLSDNVAVAVVKLAFR